MVPPTQEVGSGLHPMESGIALRSIAPPPLFPGPVPSSSRRTGADAGPDAGIAAQSGGDRWGTAGGAPPDDEGGFTKSGAGQHTGNRRAYPQPRGAQPA